MIDIFVMEVPTAQSPCQHGPYFAITLPVSHMLASQLLGVVCLQTSRTDPCNPGSVTASRQGYHAQVA